MKVKWIMLLVLAVRHGVSLNTELGDTIPRKESYIC